MLNWRAKLKSNFFQLYNFAREHIFSLKPKFEINNFKTKYLVSKFVQSNIKIFTNFYLFLFARVSYREFGISPKSFLGKY